MLTKRKWRSTLLFSPWEREKVVTDLWCSSSSSSVYLSSPSPQTSFSIRRTLPLSFWAISIHPSPFGLTFPKFPPPIRIQRPTLPDQRVGQIIPARSGTKSNWQNLECNAFVQPCALLHSIPFCPSVFGKLVRFIPRTWPGTTIHALQTDTPKTRQLHFQHRWFTGRPFQSIQNLNWNWVY